MVALNLATRFVIVLYDFAGSVFASSFQALSLVDANFVPSLRWLSMSVSGIVVAVQSYHILNIEGYRGEERELVLPLFERKEISAESKRDEEGSRRCLHGLSTQATSD